VGNTTVIELNHDFYNDIESKPELFVAQILEVLRSGDVSKRIEGGKAIIFFPRYEENKNYQKWNKFKREVNRG
jgi:hypothetical protein